MNLFSNAADFASYVDSETRNFDTMNEQELIYIVPFPTQKIARSSVCWRKQKRLCSSKKYVDWQLALTCKSTFGMVHHFTKTPSKMGNIHSRPFSGLRVHVCIRSQTTLRKKAEMLILTPEDNNWMMLLLRELWQATQEKYYSNCLKDIEH